MTNTEHKKTAPKAVEFNIITNAAFPAIMSYDSFVIFKHAERYWAADETGIREVFLTHMEEVSDKPGNGIVDFGGEYDGQSDDLKYLLSFSTNPKEKRI